MTDIVWLLRNDVPCNGDIDCAGELCNQAAEEIERLRQVLENARHARVLQRKALVNAANEIYRLRSALAEAADNLDDEGSYATANKVRAALEGKRDDKA